MIKVNWELEEVVAIVDIYFRYENETLSNAELKNALQTLSLTLNKRADILEIKHDSKFRNFTGIKMIYGNVEYVATNGQRGLSSAGKLIYEAVDLYYTNREKFNQILNKFYQAYSG